MIIAILLRGLLTAHIATYIKDSAGLYDQLIGEDIPAEGRTLPYGKQLFHFDATIKGPFNHSVLALNLSLYMSRWTNDNLCITEKLSLDGAIHPYVAL